VIKDIPYSDKEVMGSYPLRNL